MLKFNLSICEVFLRLELPNLSQRVNEGLNMLEQNIFVQIINVQYSAYVTAYLIIIMCFGVWVGNNFGFEGHINGKLNIKPFNVWLYYVMRKIQIGGQGLNFLLEHVKIYSSCSIYLG